MKKKPITDREKWHLQKQEQIRGQLRTAKGRGIARWCFTCGWFVMRTEKPHNRVCRCPGDQLKFKGNECLGWKLDLDFKNRKASLVA